MLYDPHQSPTTSQVVNHNRRHPFLLWEYGNHPDILSRTLREMLRVSSSALIVPPFECAWLSLDDYQLEGSCCLQFDCKGENDVTIILKPFPGAKRWQHLQRQQGPAGGEHLAVEQNYTVILGSHRNSKLKIERNGDEKASAAGLPGCTVSSQGFTTCWINYNQGCISVGTGAAGSSLSFQWQDPEPAIPNIRNIGLSCWDKHVSYKNVQVLPPLAAAHLQQLVEQQQQLEQQLLQQQQQRQVMLAGQEQQLQDTQPVPDSERNPASVPAAPAAAGPAAAATSVQELHQAGHQVPCLLQIAMNAIADSLTPTSLFHVLHLSELLLPRTQQLYDAAVQHAGRWFAMLVQQHLDELVTLSFDVLADILQEPLLDVPELSVFQAVAAWCQYGSYNTADTCKKSSIESISAAVARDSIVVSAASDPDCTQQQPQQQQVQLEPAQACEQHQDAADAAGAGVGMRTAADVHELLQMVRFAFMPDGDIQAVLQHPFTKQCSLVRALMHEDLQRIKDCNSASSPRGAYTFEQRRLVRPTATAAAGGSSVPSPTDHAALVKQLSQRGQTAVTDPNIAAAQGCVNTPAYSLIKSSSLCRSSSSNSSGGKAVGWRQYRRRLAPSCTELMYVCDGDRNGVIQYIGTEYGTQQWVNPVASKALTIKASSPPSRYTDPKAVVSGQFLNTSFAGPRYIRAAAQTSGTAAAAAAESSSTPSTWWQLDLGPQHRLLCNYYTIRHDGSHDGFVRSWVLQGSIDQQHWIDLRRHSNDTTIRLPGQYGSWPITGPAASMPFRAFRLLLLGPTHSPTNPWAFCLSYWELYGYFYKLGGEGQTSVHGHSLETRRLENQQPLLAQQQQEQQQEQHQEQEQQQEQ